MLLAYSSWRVHQLATGALRRFWLVLACSGTLITLGDTAQLGLAPSQDTGRIAAHLKSAGLPTRIADIAGATPTTDVLRDAIAQDKKVQRGTLTFILTRGIGQAFIEKGVEPERVARFLEAMR